MSTGTGLSMQLGIATESSYGTYAAPTRFLPIDAGGESVQEVVEPVVAELLGGPTIWRRTVDVRTYAKGAAGDIPFVALTRGFGIILRHALGSVTSDQPDPTERPNEWRHVFAPSADGCRGLSATVQIGRPRRDDRVVVPYTYLGGKVTGFELSCSSGEPLKMSTSWDFQSVDLSQPLASPTWIDGVPFIFADLSVMVNGTAVRVRQASISMDWSLATDDWLFGATRDEPVLSDRPTIEGSLSTSYTSDVEALLTAWRDGATIGPLVLTAEYGEIDAGQSNPYRLIVEVPSLQIRGEPPQVGGAGPIELSLSFEALATESYAPLTITYHTTEAMP